MNSFGIQKPFLCEIQSDFFFYFQKRHFSSIANDWKELSSIKQTVNIVNKDRKR